MEYKDRLELALEATGTGLWTYDPASGIELDRRLSELWGRNDLAPWRIEAFTASLHNDDAAKFLGLLDSPVDQDVELRIRRLDNGVERWVSLRARRSPSTDGVIVVGTARDITATKLHDAQVHHLLREVTHRSKNLLAIIQAMARQTVKDSLTATDFEARFSSRLRGLSFSHEILASQDWRGASLEDLTRGHLDHMLESHTHRVDITGPAVFIRPEAAQNIGLALNELASNALKYGALSGSAGKVAVEWSIDVDQTGPRWLHVVWNEFGGAAIAPPMRQGFGHKVMERVVARALEGIVSMTFAPTGLQWSLRIPISHLAETARRPETSKETH